MRNRHVDNQYVLHHMFVFSSAASDSEASRHATLSGEKKGAASYRGQEVLCS